MAEIDGDVIEPSLNELIANDTLRWIFVGGKGGVGKTTCSCSIAIQLAKVRETVLLLSTDPAHNLSDAFRQKFTSQPSKVKGFDNLYAMEIDPKERVMNTEDGAAAAVPEGILADIAGAVPGIDEATSFAELMKLIQTLKFSVTVFDTAPTGHTMRLLQMPQTIGSAIGKILEYKAKFWGLASSMSALLGIDMDVQEGMLAKLESVQAVIRDITEQFRDPALTTFVCVCIAEFLSLYETERLVQELTVMDFDVGNVIVNQLVPEASSRDCPTCALRTAMQRKYLAQIAELYEDFHVVRVPLWPHGEVRGAEMLTQFSQGLLSPPSHGDPAAS